MIIEFEGSISAEHGIGMLKKDDFKSTKNIREIKLMKKIKNLFDEKNILNKDKIFWKVLNWRNKTYHLKFVQFVKDLLFGVRSGS